MSFFDPGNTTYVNATLGWKFPADFGESRVGESATPAMTRRLRMDEPGRLSPARRQRDQAQFPGTDRAADLDMGWLAGHTSMDNPAHVAHDRELEPRPEPGAVVPGV